jgi:hypothetical protein
MTRPADRTIEVRRWSAELSSAGSVAGRGTATESCGWKSRARETCAVLHVRRVAPTMAR